jgi:hypothetical protein
MRNQAYADRSSCVKLRKNDRGSEDGASQGSVHVRLRKPQRLSGREGHPRRSSDAQGSNSSMCRSCWAELTQNAVDRATAMRRDIILDGASNVRDLCWPLRPRRSRNAPRVIRSAALDHLSEVGRSAFGKLGMAVVIDLRGKEEVLRAPELEGTTPVHLPIEPTKDLLAQLSAGTLTLDSTVAVMEATYRRHVVDRVTVFATVLDYILNAKRRPVLFHCAAGKDRMGLAAALVLTALAVPWPLILEDYLLNNRL